MKRSGEQAPPESFVLEIPPIAAYVGMVRLFVGSLARHFGIEEGTVQDLKLAVSEACNGAIRVRGPGPSDDPVRIVSSNDAGRLVVQVDDASDSEASADASTTEDLVRGLGLELIQALFPDVEMMPGTGGRKGVRLAVPVGASGSPPAE
jgi:serine/threonine-protein kinase RsbW